MSEQIQAVTKDDYQSEAAEEIAIDDNKDDYLDDDDYDDKQEDNGCVGDGDDNADEGDFDDEEDEDDDDDDDHDDDEEEEDEDEDDDKDDEDNDDDDEEDDAINRAHGQDGNPAIPPHPYYSYPYAYPMPPPAYVAPPVSDYLLTGTQNPRLYTDASALADPIPDTRRNRGGVTEPFPDKLHRMLDAAEREGLSDVVSFFSHGRAFAIHKTRRFVSEIMPRFFRQSKLTSFQRQLNLYGFRRISQGPDNGGYYHELFLKGRTGLSVNMKRLKVKGFLKLKRDPDTEPNFYLMPPVSATNPAPLSPTGHPPMPGYFPPPYFPPPSFPPYTAAQNGAMPYPPYPYYNPYVAWGYPPQHPQSSSPGMSEEHIMRGSPMDHPVSPIRRQCEPDSPDSSHPDETRTESL